MGAPGAGIEEEVEGVRVAVGGILELLEGE